MNTLYDVCVIGAGPAGLAATTQLAELGWTVALIESGEETQNQRAQRLADADIVTPQSHSEMGDAVWRGLGGTSALWGGRCVPLDPLDFEKKDHMSHSGWPITHADLEPFYDQACQFFGAGKANFDVDDCSELKRCQSLLAEKFLNGNGVLATQLERWSADPHVWKRHRRRVLSNPRIAVLSGFTCIGFLQSVLDGPVQRALLTPTSALKAEIQSITAKIFILACGGIETTRLILHSLRNSDGLKLRSPSLAGRFYMGHPSGKIADIEFEGESAKTIYGFERDDGTYVRRRITFEPFVLRDERLLNIAFWLDNPPLSDPQHGSGVLSAAYLALTAPVVGEWLASAAIRKRVGGGVAAHRYEHLRNCVRSSFHTIAFCANFLFQRYLARPKLPGFFTYSSVNRYALHYHAEQAPDWNNHITLAEDCDALGMRRAKIILRWSPQDIDSIIRAHEQLDRRLREQRTGRLIWRVQKEVLHDSIRQQAIDGFHQIGTLRMGLNPDSAVTDAYGKIYGTDNAFVASSAVFPTSGQANPSLSLIAFVYRQATRVDALLRSSTCQSI